MTKLPNKLNNNLCGLLLQKHKNLLNALLMCFIIFVGGELLISGITGNKGSFLSASQILLTMRLASFTALFALCQQIVICVGNGGLDLSVGYIATLTGIFAGHIMDGKNIGLVPSILLAVIIGAFFGLFNGLLISYLNLPSLVVTMAMANIIQGIVNAHVSTVAISGKAAPLLEKMTAKFSGNIPNIVFVVVFVAVIVTVFFKKTSVGQKMLGIGSNEKAAYLSGINVRFIRCMSFVSSGVIAALIGLLILGYLGHASKDMASSYVMPSIVAVVVGGVSINGGEVDYISVLFGSVFLQSLTNLFIALGLGDAGKWLGFGIILLIMLSINFDNRRKR